jgi:hypothetical protein
MHLGKEECGTKQNHYPKNGIESVDPIRRVGEPP